MSYGNKSTRVFINYYWHCAHITRYVYDVNRGHHRNQWRDCCGLSVFMIFPQYQITLRILLGVPHDWNSVYEFCLHYFTFSIPTLPKLYTLTQIPPRKKKYVPHDHTIGIQYTSFVCIISHLVSQLYQNYTHSHKYRHGKKSMGAVAILRLTTRRIL